MIRQKIAQIYRRSYNLFFHAPHTISKMLLYGSYSPPHAYISTKRQLIFIGVQKSASTSILQAMGLTHTLKPIFPTRETDDISQWHKHIGVLDKRYDNYYKFTFVRNPFDRLVSCYRQKIKDKKADGKMVRTLDSGVFFPKSARAIPLETDFPTFVRAVTKIPDKRANNHFRSQHTLIRNYVGRFPDFIGRFETLAEDWEKIAAEYGFTPQLSHENKSSDRKTPYHHHYTSELVSLVYERYKDDVNLFGYKQAYLELLDFAHSK